MWSNSLCSQPVKSCGIWAADHKAKQRWKCNKHREQHTDFGHWESDIIFLVSQKDCGLGGQRAGAELLIHSDTAVSVCCKCSNLTGQREHGSTSSFLARWQSFQFGTWVVKFPCHLHVISSYRHIHRQQPHRHRLKTLHRLIRNGPVQLRCIDTQRCQSLEAAAPLEAVRGDLCIRWMATDKHHTQMYILIYLDRYRYIYI